MNNKGKGVGLMLVVLLIVALLVVYIAVEQMSSFSSNSTPVTAQQENPVDRAQSAVDALNDRIQQQYESIEQP